MRSRFRLLICFAAAVFCFASCSSTTVVASDDRQAPSDATTNTEAADSPSADTESTDDASGDSGTANSGGSSDDGTSGDEGSSTPQTPRELEEAEGFGLGGAEQLTGLLDDCEAGNNMACDILFQLSDFESAEEAAALTCGGRSDTEVLFCTEGIDALPDQLVFDEQSPGLAEIVMLCEVDGDMTACDFLYFRSPLDSSSEEVGASCGGRVDVAVPDCRTFLAE